MTPGLWFALGIFAAATGHSAPSDEGPLLADSGPLCVIVHAGNDVPSLGKPDLASMFTGSRKAWRTGERVTVFNLQAATPLRVTFEEAVLDMTSEEVARYWIDQRVRGFGMPPRQVPTPALVVRLVSAIEGAIGYVPRSEVRAGVRIVATIDEGVVQ